MRRNHQRVLNAAIGVMALGMGASGAMGAVYESFDYAPGALGNQGGWGLRSGGTSAAHVVEGSLTFGDFVTGGNKLQIVDEDLWLPSGDIDWASDSTTYISFMANVTGTGELTGGGRFVNMGFSNTVSVVNRARVGFFSGGRVGAENLYPSDGDYSETDIYTAGTTAFFVVRLTTSSTSDDTVELMYYATPESLTAGTPDSTHILIAGRDDLTDHIQFRVGRNVTEAYLDEVRVGGSLAEVMPVPEPASLMLMGMGGLLVLRRRR